MRPLVEQLIDVLERETTLAKELVEALQRDQQLVIEHDVAALEQSNLDKEDHVLRFQSFETTSTTSSTSSSDRLVTACPLASSTAAWRDSSATARRRTSVRSRCSASRPRKTCIAAPRWTTPPAGHGIS